MRKWAVVVAVATFALVGCSKKPSGASATPKPQAAAPTPNTAPLQPALALAIDCITTCQTVYEIKADNPPPADSELPEKFANLLTVTDMRNKFEAAAKALPASLQGRLTEQPDKKPSGKLFYIVAKGQARAYVYRMAGFGQFTQDGFANADIAVDIATRDVAILMRPTRNYDEYYLAGPETLQALLLLEASANDVWMGLNDLQLAYDRNAQIDYGSKRFQLPYAKDMAERVIARLTYLNTKYKNSKLLNVALSSEELEAKRVREENAWYAADLNFASCIDTMSPAERIQVIQEAGVRARTRDRTDSTGKLVEVEVSYDQGSHERYYRFFKHKADCEASLPRNQAIPDRYR